MAKYRELIPRTKLDLWIKLKLNVLLKGYHGVGKTGIVRSIWREHDIKYLYFSAATLDPWVDLVGIPSVKDNDLKFVQRKSLLDCDAIFVDEFNRSHKKTRNAIMELIQFKSINGTPLPKLKMVWAAINPDDPPKELGLDFDVEPIDPAQLDRFQVHYELPHILSGDYFEAKFPRLKDKIPNLVSWYNDLPLTMRVELSPRRVQNTLAYMQAGGDIGDTLPEKIPKSLFLKALAEEQSENREVKAPIQLSNTALRNRSLIVQELMKVSRAKASPLSRKSPLNIDHSVRAIVSILARTPSLKNGGFMLTNEERAVMGANGELLATLYEHAKTPARKRILAHLEKAILEGPTQPKGRISVKKALAKNEVTGTAHFPKGKGKRSQHTDEEGGDEDYLPPKKKPSRYYPTNDEDYEE
jgi:hypothetical protein